MKKVKNFIQSYFDYLDNRMADTTIMVGIVGVLILGVCYIGKTDASYMQASIMDISSTHEQNIVYVDGKAYKLQLIPLQQ